MDGERRGLSPRVRGNRYARGVRIGGQGSIPARAGEPSPGRTRTARPRVYPRACGGTLSVSRLPSPSRGLSPRVRGNFAVALQDDGFCGSIPARAGEPRRIEARRSRWRVYPRACGGTECGHLARLPFSGLSPRVRGNLGADAMSLHCMGSIPARAGEPGIGVQLYELLGVYTRACGGTTFGRFPDDQLTGLYPRVRGNLFIKANRRPGSGSIPARAGEPLY